MALMLKDILKKKLHEADIGVPTLSKRTGISRKTISNWMDGQKPQNIEQVKVVADFFGLTVDELCFGPSIRSELTTPSELEKHREEINAGVFEVVLRRVNK